ncbi:DinB family protein [uncultured Chitinophaga sp.]|uniref:DinB family protein n=1 Tax=uncultured Chitinophaga sp. TaxID=339340 RepID=UPI0025E6F218|nr:DinB family protein [uncultured Chitinophaga sp.]
MPKPATSDYNPFYGTYIKLVPQNDALSAILANTPEIVSFFEQIPADKLDYAYAPGKWTVKQVLQHITDAERIFAYRALRIARADKTPLASFEENDYAEQARVDGLDWIDMIAEFKAVRSSTEYLFKSLNETELQRTGTASNSPITVNSLGFITAGHALHHRQVLIERYF